MGGGASVERFVDWFFRDRRTGRIVVGQWPNLPLALFGLAWALATFAGGETARRAAVAAPLCLAVWAADELGRGVNPWRRCLGAGVLASLAWTWGPRLAGLL